MRKRHEEKKMKRKKTETFVLLLLNQLIVSFECFIFFSFNLIEIPNERMRMVLACKKFEEKKKIVFCFANVWFNSDIQLIFQSTSELEHNK